MRLPLLSLLLCGLAAPLLAQPADTVYAFVPERARLLPSEAEAYAQIARAFRYPATAAAANRQGTVAVRVQVDTAGAVVKADVARSVGAGCDEAALSAVQGVRFAPGRKDGRAVATYVTLPVPCRPLAVGAAPIARLDPPPAPEKGCSGVAILPELIGGLEEIQRRIEYPEEALRQGISGRVLVQFSLDAQGVPHSFRLASPLLGHGLDQSAVAAVIPARFKPATCDGVPMEVGEMTLPITFHSRRRY